MKKTLTINISGVIFHIDEDAYLSLNQYLDLLRRHFSPMDDSQEILDDIENRIAEILQEKISETRQVITIEDITTVKRIMGEPNEISGGEEMPQEPSGLNTGTGSKRFFRNPEDKVIAGVCSGIGAYFHLDPVWIRLVFILAVIVFGSGILLYIILWIVMPEAITTSDKLQMRGEQVTISNIERSLREDLKELRDRLGGKTNVSSVRSSPAGPTFLETLFKGTGEILLYIFRILVILFGVILILSGIFLAIVVLAFSFGWGGPLGEVDGEMILSFPDMTRLIMGCNFDITYLQATLLMLLGIPAIGLVYSGIRMVFRIDKIRYLGMTLFNIWIVGLIIAAFFSFRIINLMRSDGQISMDIILEKPSCDTLVISFREGDPSIRYLDDESFLMFDEFSVIPSNDTTLTILPSVFCHQADDSTFQVSLVKCSRGKSRADARIRANRIHYPLSSSGDTLFISPVYSVPKSECWRGEKVILNIGVPAGKYLKMTHRVEEIIQRWGNDYVIE